MKRQKYELKGNIGHLKGGFCYKKNSKFHLIFYCIIGQ